MSSNSWIVDPGSIGVALWHQVLVVDRHNEEADASAVLLNRPGPVVSLGRTVQRSWRTRLNGR